MESDRIDLQEAPGEPRDATPVGPPGGDRHRAAAGLDERRAAAAARVGAREQGAASGQRDPEGGLGFLCAGARPATAQIVNFIDQHRGFGVEPICRVLSEHGCKIAPNTYWVAKKRPPSGRSMRDEVLKDEIARVHADNLSVYGADKVWAQLNREGIRVARCTVERLMRQMGLSGARRGRLYKVTTRHDDRQR